MAARQLELVVRQAAGVTPTLTRIMTKALRVVVNQSRADASPSDAFPVTVPVDWVQVPYRDNKPDPSAMVGADVFIGTDFDAAMGAAVDQLRAILIPAAGYDRVQPDAVPEGCIVANAYHHEAPIAEWVMTVAVMLDHEIMKSDATFRAGSWEMWPGRMGSYRELMGRTFGIIGFGSIGRRVAKLATAYEMRVIASGRTESVAGETHGAEYLGGGRTAMHRVLAEADFVLVSTPLIDETRGLISAEELSLMKPTAYLINPARGHIVDEVALYDALASRQIAGAAIDTWYEYPSGTADQPRPAKVPFWDLPNIIMTPHHSGATFGTASRRGRTVAENIDRLSRGEPLINVIAELSRP